MTTQSKLKAFEPTKGELMQIKRLITEAGRIQDKLAPELKRLDELKGEVKTFITQMAGKPDVPVVLVSGEYVAELTAEAKQRKLTPEMNRTLYNLVGMDAFFRMVKMQLTDVKKAIGAAQLDELAPTYYEGKGRRFSLVAKR